MAKKQTLKILFISYHLPLGAEPGAFRPWMESRLLKKAGFDVTVVTSGVQYMTGEDIRPSPGWCTSEEIEGIRVLRTWAPKDHRKSIFKRIMNYLSYTLLAGLASFVKVGRIQRVFVGTDPIFIMPMAYLISVIKGAKLVLDERDLFPETAISAGVLKDGLVAKCLFTMQQFFRRASSAILAATPGIQEKLLSYGIPKQKIHLLYNADVFLDEDVDDIQTVQNIRHITGKQFLVGYAGGLGIVNDIPTLLRAATRLVDLPQLGIIILGEGEMRQKYKKFCDDNDLNFVYFLGCFPRAKARAMIRQLDICVQPLLPNKHFQGTLTSKTFDYHGLGRPMVFCGKGDTVELLKESGGGISVPSGDADGLAKAIYRLYEDPKLQSEMGKAARSWYQANINIETTLQIIEAAMK